MPFFGYLLDSVSSGKQTKTLKTYSKALRLWIHVPLVLIRGGTERNWNACAREIGLYMRKALVALADLNMNCGSRGF